MNEKKIKKLVEKIGKWVGDNKWLVTILVFSVLIKLAYVNVNQAVWWDEATYLVKAKSWLKGTPDSGWWAGRTFLFPLMLTLVGGTIIGSKLLEIGFAALIVYLTHAIGKKVFGRKIGLMSALMVASSWMFNFYSIRVLTGIPSVALTMLATHLFLEKKGDRKWEVVIGASVAFASIIRFAAAVIVFPLLIHQLLNKERKPKQYYWLLATIAFSLLLPAHDLVVYGNPLESFNEFFAFNVAGPGTGVQPFWYFFITLPHIMGEALPLANALQGWGEVMASPALLLMLVGLLEGVRRAKKKKVFLFLIIIISFFSAFSIIQHKEDRFMMYVLPHFFTLSALGVKKVGEWFENKDTKKMVTLLLLALIVVSNITYGHERTLTLSESYATVAQAGRWIKQNSWPGEKVVSSSVPQNTLYSERATLSFPNTYEEFTQLLGRVKYVVVSVFENHPDYAYQLNMTPVKVYSRSYEGRDSPVLIVYDAEQVS